MRPRLNFSPAQVRAGRALRNLSAGQLAELAGLEPEAVELFESEQGDLSPSEHEALCRALYANGAGVFAVHGDLAGEGVRFVRRGAPVTRPAPALPTRRRGDGDW